MTTQEKFLNRVEGIASDFNLQFIHNPGWANTGEVRFEDEESFESLYQFGYDFQGGYCRFTGQLADDYPGAGYVMKDDLDRILEVIARAASRCATAIREGAFS